MTQLSATMEFTEQRCRFALDDVSQFPRKTYTGSTKVCATFDFHSIFKMSSQMVFPLGDK